MRGCRVVGEPDLHAKWKESAEYANAYAGLKREIEVVSGIISARTRARLTQEQLAERMDTTRGVIARLESGKTIPSTRMLVRIGAATGQQIRIGFKVHKKKRRALT
jgi:DNA-binding XRE family transcriptional regulator